MFVFAAAATTSGFKLGSSLMTSKGVLHDSKFYYRKGKSVVSFKICYTDTALRYKTDLPVT